MKKFLSCVLAFVMVFTMIPFTVFAADPCDHVLTEENISSIPNDFWDTHSADDYYVGTDAFISVTQPATCTENGWKLSRGDNSGYCMVCQKYFYQGEEVTVEELKNGEITGAVVEKTGHHYTDIGELTAATCTKASVHNFKCDNINVTVNWKHIYDAEVSTSPCTSTTTQSVGDPLGHNFVTVDIVDADCENGGYTLQECSRCDADQKIDETDPLGHALSDVEAVDASCTTDGNTAGQVCSRCDYTTVKTIPATGHDWKETDREVQEANCTNGGYIKVTETCENCGKTKVTTTTTDPLGHDVDPATEKVVLYPTCLKDGYKEAYCTRCEKTVITAILTATGHKTAVSERVEASCEAPGYIEYTCQNVDENTGLPCSYTYREILSATGHTPVSANDAAAPTCTEDGHESNTVCDVCGKVLEEGAVIPATGHTPVSADNALAPTCTVDGHESDTVCDVCGETLEEGAVIPATGHNMQILVDNSKVPTCTEDGYNLWHCMNGDCTYGFVEPLDALGHIIPDVYDEDANCLYGNKYHCERCDMDIEDEARDYSVVFSDHVKAAPNGAEASYYVDGYDFDPETDVVSTGHQYEWEFVEATCEFDAYWIGTCVRERVLEDGTVTCPEDEDVVNEVVRVDCMNTAFGHDWVLLDDDSCQEPTCTEDGVRKYICLNDHAHTYTETIPATGHQYVLDKDQSTAPTCGENGENVYVCVNVDHYGEACESVYKEVVPATGEHKYTITSTAATCTTEGYDTYTCTVCGYSYNTTTTPAKGHIAISANNAEAATCGKDGHESDTICQVCGVTIKEGAAIPATGAHKYAVESTAATCTTEGYDTYTCTVCGHSYKVTTTPATGHDYKVVSTTPATCTAEGYDTYKCANCDAAYNVTTTPAKGHIAVSANNAEAATCGKDGHMADTVCQVCGITVKTGDIIPATGAHKYAVESTAATCTAEGYDTYTCTVCGYSYKVTTTPATGHIAVSANNGVAPTCAQDGCESDVICSVCGETLKTGAVIPATGDHRYSATVTVQPTCTTVGKIAYKCEACEKTYTEEIPATGHTAVSADNGVAPTCGTDGKASDIVCSVCNATLETGEVIPATGDHVYTEVVEKPATCTEDGVMLHECAELTCGNQYTTVIPALNHNYTYVETPATCTTQGKIVATCKNCGDVQTYVIPATGHIYDSQGVYTAPTCVEDGYTTYTCVVCKKASVTKMEGKAAGHVYKASVTNPAALKADGTITTACIHCGKSSVETIPAIAKVTLSDTKYIYTGKACKPSVAVYDTKGNKIDRSNYSVSYSNNKKIGTAKVTITFKGGKYTGKIVKSFKIIPKNVGISNITTKSKKIVFTWGKVANCDGYQIQYSTSKTFKSKKTVTIKSRKTCKKTLKGLKSGKKYYIRVRAYKIVDGKKVYGYWSTATKKCK